MGFISKKFNHFKRRFSRAVHPYQLIVGLVVVVLLGAAIYSSVMQNSINPQAYNSLLATIAKGESNSNYNAYFGNGTNSSIRFTEMTIAEVIDWQKEYVQSGSPSNAVGRYQIIQPTLEGLVTQLELKPTEIFNETTQDKLAISLIERRGAKEFVEEKLSTEEFAANLAKEWAALPKIIGDNPTQSYYSGDGLNESRIQPNTILSAIETFKQAAQ